MTSDKYEAIYNNRTREWTKETTNLFKRHRTNIRNEEIATSNAELRRMGADTKRDRQYNTNVGHYGGAKDRADFLTSNIPDLLISKHIAKKDDPDTKDVDEKGKEVTVDLLSETNTDVILISPLYVNNSVKKPSPSGKMIIFLLLAIIWKFLFTFVISIAPLYDICTPRISLCPSILQYPDP
jgi:hypothetical protein